VAKKGACEIWGEREKERYTGGKRGGGEKGMAARRAARGGKSGGSEGNTERKKKESELLHPTCVFLYASLWRPFGVRYSNGLGEQQHREALESPTLVGDTCFNDYPVESGRDSFIMAMRFCRFVCASITTDF